MAEAPLHAAPLHATNAPVYSLALVLRDDGWRIYTSPTDQPSGGKRISAEQAREVARHVGDVTGTDLQPTPYEVVENGTTTHKANLEDRLRRAEEVAASVPSLRKALGEL